MDPSDLSPSGSSSASPERRRETRRKVRVQRIFAAELLSSGNGLGPAPLVPVRLELPLSADPFAGGPFGDAPQPEERGQSCFLHIHDLSDSGMRVHTDLQFPLDTPMRIKLLFDRPVLMEVQAVWQKELIGGMHVTGFKFVDISAEGRAEVQSFLDRHSPENKRNSVRLQRILVVEMNLGNTSQKFGVFTLDISTTGMKLSHDYPLPEDVDIPFRILLEYDKPPVDLVARVTWQEPNTLGQFVIGLAFKPLDPGVTARLEDFIEAQSGVGHSSPPTTMRTLTDFDDL